MFLWFVFRDRTGNPWESGLLGEDGSPKPALARFAEVAERVDGRNPVLPENVEVARVPALELAFHTPAGTPIQVTIETGEEIAVPLDRDGWLDVPVDDRRPGEVLGVRATDPYGHSVARTVRLGGLRTIEVD
jgi:hypothetical protein